jgi:predicted aldo/keto reductase-like oxidoreductase
MRLKHFHADLKGWEEKDEVREFALVAKEEGAMHFDGMSFHPKGDALTVYLAIEHEDGKVTEEKFEYARR